MSIKNVKKRIDKKQKNKVRKNNLALLSSSGKESNHYLNRCLMRSGFFKPISKKVLKRKIINGCFLQKRLAKKRILLINKKTGEKIIVAKNLKGAVTYMKKR